MIPMAESRQIEMSVNLVTAGEGKIQKANQVKATTTKEGINSLKMKLLELRVNVNFASMQVKVPDSKMEHNFQCIKRRFILIGIRCWYKKEVQ